MQCTCINVAKLTSPHQCSERAGMERSGVWSVLHALREPTEDSDLVSLSSSLLQLASTDSQYTLIKYVVLHTV